MNRRQAALVVMVQSLEILSGQTTSYKAKPRSRARVLVKAELPRAQALYRKHRTHKSLEQQATELRLELVVKDYNPDQPRDELGRFGEGGGLSSGSEEGGPALGSSWGDKVSPGLVEIGWTPEMALKVEDAASRVGTKIDVLHKGQEAWIDPAGNVYEVGFRPGALGGHSDVADKFLLESGEDIYANPDFRTGPFDNEQTLVGLGWARVSTYQSETGIDHFIPLTSLQKDSLATMVGEYAAAGSDKIQLEQRTESLTAGINVQRGLDVVQQAIKELEPLKDYNPDQPRDESGRWGEGGGIVPEGAIKKLTQGSGLGGALGSLDDSQRDVEFRGDLSRPQKDAIASYVDLVDAKGRTLTWDTPKGSGEGKASDFRTETGLKKRHLKQADPTGPTPLKSLIEEFADKLRHLTNQLEAELITADEWESSFETLLARYHTTALLLGSSTDTLTASAADYVARIVGNQFEFLGSFAAVIQGAEEWQAGFLARAESYASAIKVPYWAGNTELLPLPAMPAEGTQCLNNCGCSWDIQELDEVVGDYDCYWVRSKDDSCQTCLEREAQWSPYEIRGFTGESGQTESEVE